MGIDCPSVCWAAKHKEVVICLVERLDRVTNVVIEGRAGGVF